MTASFDTSFFILDDFKYHYKLSKDLLTIWIINDSKDSIESYADDTIQYNVEYIDNDSLILTDLSPDNEIIYGKNLRFYSNELLYDSLIQVESITYELSRLEGSYPYEAVTLKRGIAYIRVDSGSVEIEPNRFVRKMIDYKINVNDSSLNEIQDLIRYIDIENTDTIFPKRFISSHTFWTVTIKYNNKQKILKGYNLPPSFRTIWNNTMGVVYKYDFEKIEEIYGNGWVKK